ncbi:hypothetical protein K439DRAFT_1647958 [Ramaria rubella]|nr:hypothetical protein K439DRAFT_1647958 [Ramaria rubella]
MASATRNKKQTSVPAKKKAAAKATPRKSASKAKKTPTRRPEKTTDEDDPEDAESDALSENEGEAYEVFEADDAEDLDSDALDDDDTSTSGKKRKRPSSKSGKRKSSTSPKKRKRKQQSDEDDSDDLPEGVTVVGKVVKAPTEGRVPPGQISQNTLDFFKQLARPECNDREWLHILIVEPVYRQAEKEWKDWIEAFTPLLAEVDDQIPELPPKDVMHRIYRDIRFSNDKTPYKTGFSASFSRSGRKGTFAHFKPSGQTLIAAGAWCPGKNELASIRHHIVHNPSRLRNVISDPEFVKFFGEPSPHPKRERQNVFGQEDELKVAPKGVDKNHKDIDLLKLRSIAVFHSFLDSEVTAPDFKEAVCRVIKVMQPLVHCLNDMMTLPVDDENSESEEAEEAEEDTS